MFAPAVQLADESSPPPPRILADASGSVAGTITDQAGAVLTRARVQVATEAGAPILAVSSNDLGLFSISNLRPGNYRLNAVAPGFVRREVNVTVGSTPYNLAPIELKVGSTGEVVQIPSSPLRRLWCRVTR